MIPMNDLRAQGSKPVRITRQGEIFIGDDEIPYPIVRDSVSVRRQGISRNILTLSLVVGEVTMETKPPKGDAPAPPTVPHPEYRDGQWHYHPDDPCAPPTEP